MTTTLLEERPPTALAPTRRLLHSREVQCHGYERSDGLYDIEARMQDISPDGSDMLFKKLAPGDRIHDMRLTITIDRELKIHHVDARLETGPTPWCADISTSYDALK